MFKRKTDAAPAPAISVNDAVQQARTRARQRLIGAVVLLVIGVIGFPLVFESQPRPIPVDIPIDIPKKDGASPLVTPAPRSSANGASTSTGDVPMVAARDASKDRADPIGTTSRDTTSKPMGAPTEEMITESRGDAGRDVTSAPRKPTGASSVASVTPPAPIVKPTPTAAAPSPSTPVAIATRPPKRTPDGTPAPAAAAAPDPSSSAESARARALLEGAPVAAADAPRYIVQVGAFADAEAARAVRLKVEKLGMKTYTQIAQAPSGGRMIRVRVGPFASRDEADRALAKARGAGIAANVLTL